MAYENQRIQDAYEAGRNCRLNGPNLVNAHYTWFATPEMKEAWERGKLDGGIQLDKSKALLEKLKKENIELFPKKLQESA